MTIGQLVECLTGKVSSLAGSEGDGTAFNTAITVDSVARVLHSMGYQVRWGWGVLLAWCGCGWVGGWVVGCHGWGERGGGGEVRFIPTYLSPLHHSHSGTATRRCTRA